MRDEWPLRLMIGAYVVFLLVLLVVVIALTRTRTRSGRGALCFRRSQWSFNPAAGR
jgi:hypothetical protein